MFQAERAAAARARRDADAAREFAENAEFFKNTEALAAKDRASARYKRELAFMYQKPPGFDAALEREKAEKARRLVIYRNRGDWPSEAVLSHQEGGCLSGELMAGWR